MVCDKLWLRDSPVILLPVEEGCDFAFLSQESVPHNLTAADKRKEKNRKPSADDEGLKVQLFQETNLPYLSKLQVHFLVLAVGVMFQS